MLRPPRHGGQYPVTAGHVELPRCRPLDIYVIFLRADMADDFDGFSLLLAAAARYGVAAVKRGLYAAEAGGH